MPEIILDASRVLFSLLFSQRERVAPTGIDRVCLEYINHFHEDARALINLNNRWRVLSKTSSRIIFDAILSSEKNYFKIWRQLAKNYLSKEQSFSEPPILINPSDHGLGDIRYEKKLIAQKIRPVFFLHDLIPITHTRFCGYNAMLKHKNRLSTMLNFGEGIIINSRAVYNDFERYAEENHFKIPPFVVAPLAPAPLPTPSNARPLEKPYFIVLSTIEPRKNHILLLKVWQQLVAELGEQAPHLVIIGKRGWDIRKEIDMLDSCKFLKGIVIEKSYCNDKELATWLYHAQALLFPTFVEGFGMPLHEALALGVPAIASDLPVFYETAGNIPEYIDPHDKNTWKQVIINYTPFDSRQRLSQCERLQHYQLPTWKKHFSKVEELVNHIKAAQ